MKQGFLGYIQKITVNFFVNLSTQGQRKLSGAYGAFHTPFESRYGILYGNFYDHFKGKKKENNECRDKNNLNSSL